MDASWLTKYPKAAALLHGEGEVLDYAPDGLAGMSIGDAADTPPADMTIQATDPLFAHGVPSWALTQGVMTAPLGARQVCHRRVPSLADVRANMGDLSSDGLSVCTTDYLAPVCTCGAWSLRWEREIGATRTP